MISIITHRITRPFQRTPLNKRIIRISVPVFFAMISNTAVMVTDTAMVGSLGRDALAATGLAGTAFVTILSFLFGGAFGIQIITARRFGEKNFKALGQVLATSIVMALVISAIATPLGFYTSEYMLSPLLEDKSILPLAALFMSIRFLGLPFLFIRFVLNSFYDGLGRTEVGMYSSIVTTISNIFLNWVLIYGHLGAPAMGVKGAAIASGLAGVAGLLVFVFYLLFRKLDERFDFKHARFHAPTQMEIFKVSIVTAIDELFLHISFLLFYKLSGMISVLSMAATNIVVAVMSLSFMPGFSFGVAATTIVSQSLGAKHPNRAYYSTHRSALFAALVMGLVGVSFILFTKPLLGIFTPDQEVIQEATPALLVVALVQCFYAYNMVMNGALRGAGRVYFVMAGYSISALTLMLPLGYLLGIHLELGTTGLWTAIGFWFTFMGLLFTWKFNRRDWDQVKI